VTHYRFVPDESRVWVDARSSVHKIHSTADGIGGFVELDFVDGDGVDPTKPPAGQLSLPVRRLTSGNSLEDRELQKFVDVARYPTIDGVLTALERVEGERYRISGDLALGGVSRPCQALVRITPVDDRTIRLEGQSTFDIRDFGLQPPRILMLRVEPTVVVRIKLIARTPEE
jgi:polyisoprenoid-binding protein YceI